MADTAIALLKNFPLVNSSTHEPSGSESTQGIAIVTKQSMETPVPGETRMYRLDPSTDAWTPIGFTSNVGVGSAIAADEASATIDGDAAVAGEIPIPVSIMSMPDAVVFPLGVPSTTGRAGLSTDQVNDGQVKQPAFIWTNNVDPVFIYPRANGVLEYEPLTNQFGTVANPCDFRCVSLEVFADRVNFFNTMEAVGGVMVRHANRLRWSARGTADPDPAAVGASSMNFNNFAGQGVKIRKLGSVLACYFQDGVSLVTETGQASVPYSQQNLEERRGLLSTHGLVPISKNEHFGVFDDGWWILDASGRWREVGVVSIDGQPIHKWKTFFYRNFNLRTSHRLQLYYDELHHWVRMCVPDPGNVSRVTEEWIYDIRADRVWRDRYPGGLSVFGDITIRGEVSLLWSQTTDLWSTIFGSWQSYESPSGEVRMVHGTESGFTYYHSDDFITRDGEQPIWSIESVPSAMAKELSLKTADRLVMEHVDAGNESGVALAVLTADGRTSSQTKDLNFGDPGKTVLSQSHHHITSERLAYQASGSGAIAIRSFILDYIEDEVESVAR